MRTKFALIAAVVLLLVAVVFGFQSNVMLNSTTPSPHADHILGHFQHDSATPPNISVEVPTPVLACAGATKPTCGTSVSLPSCVGGGTGSTAGYFWYTQGNSTTKDNVEVCAHDALNTYAWRTIY